MRHRTRARSRRSARFERMPQARRAAGDVLDRRRERLDQRVDRSSRPWRRRHRRGRGPTSTGPHDASGRTRTSSPRAPPPRCTMLGWTASAAARSIGSAARTRSAAASGSGTPRTWIWPIMMRGIGVGVEAAGVAHEPRRAARRRDDRRLFDRHRNRVVPPVDPDVQHRDPAAARGRRSRSRSSDRRRRSRAARRRPTRRRRWW